MQDKPGALAKVATVLGDAGISIDRMRQYGQHSPESVPVLVVTHKTTPEAIERARRSTLDLERRVVRALGSREEIALVEEDPA